MIDKQRIQVIKLGALGDFIQAAGPFKAIRLHHKADHITLLTSQDFVDIAIASHWFDHVKVDAAPPIIAFNVNSSPIHSVKGVVTETDAPSLIVKLIVLCSATHAPAGSSVVSVRTTEPNDKSPTLGVYTAPRETSLLNVPEPFVVQVAVLAVPPIEPLKAIAELEQTTSSAPAETMAGNVNV